MVIKLSEHSLLSRYLKKLYHRRPPLPKYVDNGDVNLVLSHYDHKDQNENLKYKNLLKKTVLLFLIIVAIRKQSTFT